MMYIVLQHPTIRIVIHSLLCRQADVMPNDKIPFDVDHRSALVGQPYLMLTYATINVILFSGGGVFIEYIMDRLASIVSMQAYIMIVHNLPKVRNPTTYYLFILLIFVPTIMLNLLYRRLSTTKSAQAQ